MDIKMKILGFLHGHEGDCILIGGHYRGRIRRYKIGALKKEILTEFAKKGGGNIVETADEVEEGGGGYYLIGCTGELIL